MTADTAITQLLRASQHGDAEATDRLIPLIYDRLHSVAGVMMRQERPGHTLSATALVHESYLRLAQADIDWEGRAHFFRLAACMMRRILVDHAKAKRRGKRGGGWERVSLDDPAQAVQVPDPSSQIGILELDDALTHLARQDERKARIVELLYFGGLTCDEAAAAVSISPATLHRELRLAKAWLQSALSVEPRT